ncbi:MAG TPA: hypothetical protein VF482_10320 [Trebonia sp.]
MAGRGRSRRVSIPGVAELLRPAAPDPVVADERPATGRERHDQKITVYLSAAELIDLEHARLALRRFGFVVDRGRLVREAIAILLADLDARGTDSAVARRIRASRGSELNGSREKGGEKDWPADTAAEDADGMDDTAGRLPSLLCLKQAVRR